MKCVIESVMELMVDTHTAHCDVCVWEIIFIVVIIIGLAAFMRGRELSTLVVITLA